MNHVEFVSSDGKHRWYWRWQGVCTMGYARGMQALLDAGYTKVYEVRAAS